MAKLTPPLGTRGRYTLKTPFTTDAATLYTCAALRSFRDIQERGYNPFNEFYEPMGIEIDAYEDDVAIDANIITLTSDTQPVIYVPDTYILSYPNQDYVLYNQMVLSISLGLVPAYLETAFLESQISALVSDIVGASPEVTKHLAPTYESLTPSEHEVLEVARQQAINMRTTDRVEVLDLQAKNDALNSKIANLEAFIIDKGLI